MNKTTFNLLGIVCCLGSSATQAQDSQVRYSAANAITFEQSELTKDFVGSAFLIKHKLKTYAVTAKHVLLETMDQGIDHITTKGYVKSWQLRPFNETTGVVKLGKMLNEDSQQKLDIEVLADDWLLFDVESNESALTPLTVAAKAPKVGEEVLVYGCNYGNQTTCQQNKLSGRYVKTDGVNLMIKLATDDMSQLRGLSGAPVLNKQLEVVGIVSNVVPDEDSGGFYFAPFIIDPVREYLSKKPANTLN